jgi:hypothetical protein
MHTVLPPRATAGSDLKVLDDAAQMWRAASMLAAIMMFSSPLRRTGNLQIPAFSPSPGIEAPAERRSTHTSSPSFIPDPSREEAMTHQWRYSEFYEAVKRRKVDRVVFSSDLKKLVAFDLKGERYPTTHPSP